METQKAPAMLMVPDWYPEAKDTLPEDTLMEVNGIFEETVFQDSTDEMGCTIHVTWDWREGALVWSCKNGPRPSAEDVRDFFESIFYDAACYVANAAEEDGDEELEHKVRSAFDLHH